MPTTLQLTLTSCIFILSIKGQDIKPVNICDTNTVAVDRGYAGIIEHREIEGAPVRCSLTLRAPAGSYISIPRVDVAADNSNDTCLEIQIDGTTYCIDSTQPKGFIQEFTQEQSVLSVSSLSNMTGFNLEYFTIVTSCDEDIQIPDRPQVEQLTGIFTSSYAANKQSLSSCEFTISNLPSEAHYVRFDIITVTSPLVRDSWFIDNQEFANFPDGYLHNITSTNNQLSVRNENEGDPVSGDVESVFFMIQFTVLTCGDKPEIDHVTSTPSTESPWFPGTIINYSCEDTDYQLKYNSTSECKVGGTEAKWVNQSEIRCIPVPYCTEEPRDVEFTNKTKTDTHTTVYECIKGYESRDGIEEVVSTCSSSDTDNIPWIWSNISLTCTPVECDITDLSINTTTTNITSKGGTTHTYVYQDVLSYDCYRGYKKTNMDVIQCQHDETWSSVPECTETAECDPAALTLPNGTITLDRYYGGDNLLYSCDKGYSMTTDPVCTQSGNWSHDPGCVVSNEEPGIVTTEPRVTGKPLETHYIALIAGGGALVVVIIVVVLIARCLRHSPKEAPSGEANNRQSLSKENPYFELERPDVIPTVSGQGSVGNTGPYGVIEDEASAYAEISEGVVKKPDLMTKPKPNKEKFGNVAELYASVQLNHPRKPEISSQPAQPIYEEAPVVPPKADEVEFVDNSLYDSSGAPAGRVNVEMLDNDLYDRTSRVNMLDNDLYDRTDGQVNMLDNDLYDRTDRK